MAKKKAAPSRRRKPSKTLTLRQWLYAVEGACCVALLGWIAWAFYQFVRDSGEFNLHAIHVEGASATTPYDIVAASTLTKADNVLLFDRRGTRRNVEAMPYVKSCAVDAVFPDTVVLRVEERRPAATLLIDNRSFEIDDELVVLRELDHRAPHVDPFVTGIDQLEFVQPGDRIDNDRLAAALDVWKNFASTYMAQDVTVSEIESLQDDDIRMYCDELPFVIRWGRENFADQAKRLDVLWREKKGDLGCREYLDLRWGEDLACK